MHHLALQVSLTDCSGVVYCTDRLQFGSCRRHIPSLVHLTDGEKLDLADVIGGLSRAMDNLYVAPFLTVFSSRYFTNCTKHRFECSFGYSMGVYQAPVHRSASATVSASEEVDWSQYAQLHIGFYPPLLRSSTVKKFLVG